MDASMQKYYLQPGFIFISEQQYNIHTVLGSCVSVCIWDAAREYGGMNHYIYDRPTGNEYSARYGTASIRHMLDLFYDNGSSARNLKAHIVGGGFGEFSDPKVGAGNVAVAEEILERNGIVIITKDTGGQTGRKVIFNNYSGEIIVYKGIDVRKGDWYSSRE
jgi:chemotaxis protein CheD